MIFSAKTSSFFATSKPPLSLTKDLFGLQSNKDRKLESNEGRPIQPLDSGSQNAIRDRLRLSRPPAARHHLVGTLTPVSPRRVMGADALSTSILASTECWEGGEP